MEEKGYQKPIGYGVLPWATFDSFLAMADGDEENTNRALAHFYNGQSLGHAMESQFSVQTTKARVKKLLPLVYRLYVIKYPKMNTRAVKCSGFRKVLKEHQKHGVYEISLNPNYFGLTSEEQDDLFKKAQERIDQKNMNREQLPIAPLLDTFRRMYEASKLDTVDIYELGAFLMLASGMRPLDLFQNVVTDAFPDDPDNKVIAVSNMAKKRGADGINEMVRRPVILITARYFKERLEFFRHLVGDRKYGTGFIVNLGDAVRKFFPALRDLTQSSSMMRKYYVALAYALYSDPAHMTYTVFIKNVLGHGDDRSALNYAYINLTGEITPEMREEIPYPAQAPRPVRRHAPFNPALAHYPRATRKSTAEQKTEIMENIYRDIPTIGHAQLKQLSGVGSDAVSVFLKAKRRAVLPIA